MNRRMFLKGLTAAADGLMVPDRRVWALDQTMIPRGMGARVPVLEEYASGGLPSHLIVMPIPDWVRLVKPVETPLLGLITRNRDAQGGILREWDLLDAVERPAPRMLPVSHPEYFETGHEISLGSERFRVIGKMAMRIDDV